MNKELGKLIKDSREAKGISQRELARSVGVDNAGISRIEKGLVVKPNYLLLIRIAKVLGINTFDLVCTANYSLEEAQSLGLNGINAYFECAGADKRDKFLITDASDNIRLSYVKILKGYKENKIDLKECTGLLCDVFDIDIRQYLTDKELIENELGDVLKFIDKT